MKLWTYVGKFVLIETIDGKKYIGEATGYDSAEDNLSGEDSLNLDIGLEKVLLDFDESEIKSIQIIGITNRY